MTYAMPLRAARPTATRVAPTSFANNVAYDWVAVDLAIRGELRSSQLHTEDREEVIRRLNGQGYTDREITDKTTIPIRTVQRVRKRLHLDTALPIGVTTRAYL
ncbi:hypothetical protein ACLBWP_03545 [Microbacterium sp. M1A1_1b]